jgi:hypothetical protein
MCAACIGVVAYTTPACAQAEFENPPALRASDFLPADILKGPHHEVGAAVNNDGYMNTYTIKSSFGTMVAVSTPLAAVRVNEINAMAAMAEVEKTEEFKGAAKEAATGAYEGAKQLVTKPVETVGGAVTGVGRLFRRGAESFQGTRSESEDAGYKSLIGFSKSKRNVAKEFGVDVYSSNDLLQEKLEEVAWTGYAGDMTITAPLAFVPGGVGVAVTATQTVTALNETIALSNPKDLRLSNREDLAKMGVGSDLIDLYIENATFTPRQQTLIVAALALMDGTANRSAFIKQIISTNTQDLAFFRVQQAAMYAAYHNKVEPITAFITSGSRALGESKSGKLVFIAPVDHLVWTRFIRDNFMAVNEFAESRTNLRGRVFWVGGTVSDTARKAISSEGWEVLEDGHRQLHQALKEP